MVEIASTAGQMQDAAPRRKDDAARGDAPGFSYALAAASLEKSAAQSLKTHGATPESAATPPSGRTEAAARGGRSDKAAIAQRDAKTSPQVSPATTNDAVAAAAKSSSSAPVSVAAAVQVRSTPVAAGAPAALQAKAADTAVIRDLTASKAKTPALKAPRLQPPAPALRSEFAEILARRLEKTSVFELRLDPPDLGRVDGRLAVSDDGKAVLSLTFDTQTAFDHFSRDEQALRHMLAEAGLNFSSGDLVFAFKERPEAAAFRLDFADAQSAESRDAYEPRFFAEWSAGALDIRI